MYTQRGNDATNHNQHLNFKQFNKNPISGQTCKEAFTTINKGKIPNDLFIKAFYGSLGMLGIYLLFKLTNKHNKLK